MPLGKYYCDYCDKQFQDTPSARKRHIQGVQHQRARALYYDSLSHPTPAGVCHRFLRTGFCHYGDGCKYLHPRSDESTMMNPSLTLPGPSPKLMFQAPKTLGNQPSSGSLLGAGDMLKNNAGISWGTLPPSLRPPPEGGYPTLPLVDWG